MSPRPPRPPVPQEPEHPASVRRRAHLQHISIELRTLHKSLMEEARSDYERERGPIGSPGAFLQLLMGDPFFSWLRALSSAMADLDELVDVPTAIEESHALAVRNRFDTLVAAGEDDEIEAGMFGVRYREYLQRSPDVVMAHAAVRIALRRLA